MSYATHSAAPQAAADISPDAPSALSHGSARTLAAALADARQHTLGLIQALAAALPGAMELRYLPELNPPLWLLAELAWREDGSIARNPLRRQGQASAAGFARGPAALPQYEHSFGPAISHAERWHQPLPGLPQTLAWLRASRERSLALLRGTPHKDMALHVYRKALWHEDALREVLLGIAQTLGILPGPLAAAPLPCPAPECELALPLDTHRLGAPATGYAPETDLPEHEVELRAFSIDRSPVTWGRYLPFIEAGGYDEARWWTPEGGAWRRRHSLGRPRHLGHSDDGHWQLAQFGLWVPLNPNWPAMHLSRHEALAWCRWAGRRLPSEWEWEAAARHAQVHGEAFHWGQVREWTATSQCLRGASHLGAPRLATLWRRWSAADECNDGFVGFRSCAASEGELPHDQPHEPGPNAVAEADEPAPSAPARKRASRKKQKRPPVKAALGRAESGRCARPSINAARWA